MTNWHLGAELLVETLKKIDRTAVMEKKRGEVLRHMPTRSPSKWDLWIRKSAQAAVLNVLSGD